MALVKLVGVSSSEVVHEGLNLRTYLNSNGYDLRQFVQPTVEDAREGMQAAIDAIAAAGGGTLVIPVTTTPWRLNSYGTGPLTAHAGVIQLRSGVDIKLEGVVQLGSFFDNKIFQVFVGFEGDAAASPNLNDCHIYGGGVLDFNNAPEPTSGSVLRNGFTLGKSYNCSLRNITVRNGDVTWAVTTGWNGYGSNTYVEDCTFTNLVRTSANPDHSTVYINCPNSGVRRCSFYAAGTRGRLIAAAVELHQHDNWFEDSNISGYARGVYVTMHGAEAAGAGNYTNNVLVRGNSGDISGQFALFVADLQLGVQGHINGAVVSGNIIIQPEGYANGAFVSYAEGNAGVVNLDVSGVLVQGNSYSSPASSDAAAFHAMGTMNGVTFSNNFFDCRRAVLGPDQPVACRGLVWDESNVMGPTHSGLRAGTSLFELRFGSIVNCNIVTKLHYPDTSPYSIVLVPPSATITNSTIKVGADFITTDRNAVVLEGNQYGSAGLNLEFPITLEMQSPTATGTAPYISSSTSFGWATGATPLNNTSGSSWYQPSALSVKGTGQLAGLGWNDVSGSRTVYMRVLLRRFL